MNSMQILKAVGGADDALLDAYARDSGKKPRKSSWVRLGSLAACLCLLAAATLLLPRLAGVSPREPAPPDAQTQADAPQQNAAVPIINGSGYAGSAACYVMPEPGTTLLFVEVRDAVADWRGSSAMLFLALDINDASGALADDSAEQRTETERLASLGYEVGRYETWAYAGQGEKVPDTFLYILISVEELEHFSASPEYGYSFSFPHNGDGSAVEYTGAGDLVSERRDPPPPPTELSEAEAYAEIGAYLPASAPEGFVFASAYLSDGAVSVTWTQGRAALHWTVSDMTEADAARQTAAANSENYDLSLYPPPRAQSVPEDRRAVVDDPVFLLSELTQAVVNRRADGSSEPGGEGVRLRFGVHYSDSELLVELNAKGVSPEWVYAQLTALPNDSAA